MSIEAKFEKRLSILQVEESQSFAPKFDDNGLMHCSFKDVESGDKKDIQIGDINPSSSGPNKMDEFTVD